MLLPAVMEVIISTRAGVTWVAGVNSLPPSNSLPASDLLARLSSVRPAYAPLLVFFTNKPAHLAERPWSEIMASFLSKYF